MQANSVTSDADEPAGNDLGPLAWVLDELRKSLDSDSPLCSRCRKGAWCGS
jgi:hypothetical protein